MRKKLDNDGFTFLRTVVDKAALGRLEFFLPGIFSTIFYRLQSSKTEKFVRNLIPFVFFLIVRHGPDFLIGIVEQVQNGIFGMLMDRVVLLECGKISKMSSRRLCVVGLTRLLTESSKVLGGQFDSLWIPTLIRTVELLEKEPEKEAVEDVHTFDLSSDDPTLNLPTAATIQNQLVFAKKPERDPILGIGDLKAYLASQLSRISQFKPGMVTGKIGAADPKTNAHVNTYCRHAGVTLS